MNQMTPIAADTGKAAIRAREAVPSISRGAIPTIALARYLDEQPRGCVTLEPHEQKTARRGENTPEQAQHIHEKHMQAEKPGGFWRESMEGLRPLARVLTYFYSPKNLTEDFSAVRTALSDEKNRNANGIFVINVLFAELVAMPVNALVANYFSAKYGHTGAAVGTTFGGILPWLAAQQIGWLATYCALKWYNIKESVGMGASALKHVAKSITWEHEQQILKMAVRGIMINLPVYGVYLGMATWFAWHVGDTSALVSKYVTQTLEFVAMTSIAISVNADVIKNSIAAMLPIKKEEN